METDEIEKSGDKEKIFNSSVKIMTDIVKNVKKSGFDGKTLVVSPPWQGPSDTLVLLYQMISECREGGAISFSCALRYYQLKQMLSKEWGVPESVIRDAYPIGTLYQKNEGMYVRVKHKNTNRNLPQRCGLYHAIVNHQFFTSFRRTKTHPFPNRQNHQRIKRKRLENSFLSKFQQFNLFGNGQYDVQNIE